MADLESEQDPSPVRDAVRFWIACLVAPLTPWLVFACFSPVSGTQDAWWSFQLFAIIFYPAFFLLGLPAHLVFRKLAWKNLFVYALAGLLVGDAIVAGLGFWDEIGFLALGAIFGAISATAFWAIARPDRAWLSAERQAHTLNGAFLPCDSTRK